VAAVGGDERTLQSREEARGHANYPFLGSANRIPPLADSLAGSDRERVDDAVPQV
jgi:hypothetical protein